MRISPLDCAPSRALSRSNLPHPGPQITATHAVFDEYRHPAVDRVLVEQFIGPVAEVFQHYRQAFSQVDAFHLLEGEFNRSR